MYKNNKIIEEQVVQPLAIVMDSIKCGEQLIKTKGLITRIEKGLTKKSEPYILLMIQDKNTTHKIFMWDNSYTSISVKDVIQVVVKPFGKDAFTFIDSQKLNENPIDYLDKVNTKPELRKEIFVQMFQLLANKNRKYSTIINNIVTPYSKDYFHLSTVTHSKVGGFSEFQYKALNLYKTLQIQDSIILLSIFLLDIGELLNSYVGVPEGEIEEFEIKEREKIAFNTIKMLFEYSATTLKQEELHHLQHIILASTGIIEAETNQAKIVKQIRDLVICSEKI